MELEIKKTDLVEMHFLVAKRMMNQMQLEGKMDLFGKRSSTVQVLTIRYQTLASAFLSKENQHFLCCKKWSQNRLCRNLHKINKNKINHFHNLEEV